MTVLSLIVACAENGTIGLGGAMPWHLPADLKYFKAVTMGKPVVMGSVTYQSIGRALPGRHNIVINRNPDFLAPGCDVVPDLKAAIAKAGPVEEIMVIGGAKIYALALPLAQRIYLTRIHQVVEGDRSFPPIGDEWSLLRCDVHQAEGAHPAFSFTVLERCHPSDDRSD